MGHASGVSEPKLSGNLVENSNGGPFEFFNGVNYNIDQREEKKIININNDETNIENFKNINSQIYEYTRFLTNKDRHRSDI